MVNLKSLLLREVLDEAVRSLGEVGIEAPRMEARLLAGLALGCDAAGLITRDAMTEAQYSFFCDLLARRVRREPMALIAGTTGFWNLTLEVSRSTLIPRADTESLVELLLALRPDYTRPLQILDLGTGTGCLLLAALSLYPGAFGVGVDLSAEAVALARRNAAGNGLMDRSVFCAGNWSDALDCAFDVILSNPPYIRASDMEELMPEVRDHEPARALDGGIDGLDAYRAILDRMPGILAPDGLLLFELGQGQEADVAHLARERGMKAGKGYTDLGGIVRALPITWMT